MQKNDSHSAAILWVKPFLLWYYTFSRLHHSLKCKTLPKSITGNILCLVLSWMMSLEYFYRWKECLETIWLKQQKSQEGLAAPEKGVFTELSDVIWIFTHVQSNWMEARCKQFWYNYDFILNTGINGIAWKVYKLFTWSPNVLYLRKDIKQMHVFIFEYENDNWNGQKTLMQDEGTIF